MPAHDRRTPEELLAEADQLARLLLLDGNGHSAPAMLRAFPTLVEAAAQLWSVLPGVPLSYSGGGTGRRSGWSPTPHDRPDSQVRRQKLLRR